MPFTGPGDPNINERVRTFWKNIRATPRDKRKWVNVFNSCFNNPPEGTSSAEKDGVCSRVATGVVSRDIRARRNLSLSNMLIYHDMDFQLIVPEHVEKKKPLEDNPDEFIEGEKDE